MSINSKAECLISVVIPAFNHEHFIEESVASVLNQSYRNIELILLDNCSSDKTYERALAAVRKLDNGSSKRHQIIKNERNLGLCRSLNKGLSLLSGDYVFVLYSDNYLHRECISELVEVAQRNKEFKGLFFCDYYYVDVESVVAGSYAPDYLGSGILDRTILLRSIFAPSGNEFRPVPYLVSRESIEKYGGYDENFGCEDFDFYIRYAVGPGMYRLPKKLHYFRIVPNSLGARANEYADSLVPAVCKYESALGDSFPRFLLDTQKRTVRAFIDNGFYSLGFSRLLEYLKSSGDLRSSYRILSFSIARLLKRVIKKSLPEPVLGFLRRMRAARADL